MPRIKRFLALALLPFAIMACSSSIAPAATDVPGTPTAGNIPLTEADVPRISLEEARAAIESGAAVVVDVRSMESFAAGHIPGAISIQLNEFETNPAGIGLDKDQWIITYCT